MQKLFPVNWELSSNSIKVDFEKAANFPNLEIYSKRVLHFVSIERDRESILNTRKNRALIFGAGELGRQLVGALSMDTNAQYSPVAFIDDDVELFGQIIEGLPVIGDFETAQNQISDFDVTHVIVSIARANSELLQKVYEFGKSNNISVLVFPPLNEVLQGAWRPKDVRKLDIETLVGRSAVDTSIEEMVNYISNKVVLVTGAGGSIGAELCRQISKLKPSRLLMLDRDETALQSVQMLLGGDGLLTSPDILLADIRDREVIDNLITSCKPNIIFHAAALKHLPMLERFPDEAWKTNVIGTENLLVAASKNDVDKFINISTDKAAAPSSVLGHSKRIAERLTSSFSLQNNGDFVSVRFGNVLASRGSLIPVFSTMIERGGPITVTDPEVTRFFMSIPEACQLVLQAGGIGNTGDVLILDMGKPVKILDIAEKMIELSGKNIEIVFTGLRPGEKLHEELFSGEQEMKSPLNDFLSHASVQPLSLDEAKVYWSQNVRTEMF